MCLGAIVCLVETWEEDSAKLGRLADGRVVPLVYVPEARAGDNLLLHLGIPTEVISAQSARDALELRSAGGAR